MELRPKQKKMFLIIGLICVGIFFLELVFAKFGYLSLEKINRYTLGLLLLSPTLGAIFIVPVTYDNWFRTRKTVNVDSLMKVFFLILALFSVIILISLYMIFVF